MYEECIESTLVTSIAKVFFGIEFLPARRYASAVLALVECLSVRLSVCHKSVFY